jgi:hypothetical protein
MKPSPCIDCGKPAQDQPVCGACHDRALTEYAAAIRAELYPKTPLEPA